MRADAFDYTPIELNVIAVGVGAQLTDMKGRRILERCGNIQQLTEAEGIGAALVLYSTPDRTFFVSQSYEELKEIIGRFYATETADRRASDEQLSREALPAP